MKKKVYSLHCLAVYSILFFLVSGFWLLVTLGYAEELTILYTGDTHAMLYQCSCPVERDGGVARRATLIKQLRKKHPNILVIDAGRFFAGGLSDEYIQNTELDMQRTRINLTGLQLMKYDAAAISDDEFNFGKEFLKENAEKFKVPFLSCNIDPASTLRAIKPYIIKEIAGIKIGIIGVTGISAQQKAGGLKFIDPRLAVKEAVEKLTQQSAGIIILLSNLEESQSLELIKEIPQINVLIMGRSHTKGDFFDKIGSTLIMKPAWQGRRLSIASLTLKENKITHHEVDELRLSDKIADDPEILSILPKCFSDANCKKEGFIGACQEAGTLKSSCIFSRPAKMSLLIISPKVCKVCDTEKVIGFLRKKFLGLEVSYLYYPGSEANKLIKDFGIKELPVYLLSKDIEKEKQFDSLKGDLEIKGVFYMLKSKLSGISYFIERKAIKGKLDLFLSLYDKNAFAVLGAAKEFNPTIHFLAVEVGDSFESPAGNAEVEEYLRSVCVQKYYPAYFWNYISCRSGNIGSSWWEDCLEDFDTDKIKNCARQDEGKNLLRENIRLNKELQVMFGPTYLLDNQEIFSSSGEPKKEELRDIITQRR